KLEHTRLHGRRHAPQADGQRMSRLRMSGAESFRKDQDSLLPFQECSPDLTDDSIVYPTIPALSMKSKRIRSDRACFAQRPAVRFIHAEVRTWRQSADTV